MLESELCDDSLNLEYPSYVLLENFEILVGEISRTDGSLDE